MSTLGELRTGLGRAWSGLAEGWRSLRERAAHAVTHFNARPRKGELQTVEDQVMQGAPRWGLLAAEVQEGADRVDVRLEVPGLEPEDFDVSVEGGYLVVRGEKRLARERGHGRYHVMECAYGHFERAVALPVEVDEAGARAKYRHGVLQITLPKHPAARTRRVEVQVD